MRTLHKTGWFKRLLVAACACLTALMLAGCSLTGLADTIGDLMGGKTGYKKDGLTYRLSADGTYYSLVDCEEGIAIPNILTEIDGIPVTTIASNTFINNRQSWGLSQLIIPNSITTLEDNCVSQCFYLGKVVIPDSVTYIGKNAFYHCRIMGPLTIGAGVQYIGDYAFYNCFGLKEAKTFNYTGTSETWAKIQIGEGNQYLTEAKINFITAE